MWKILRGARQLAAITIITATAFTSVEASATDSTISQNTSGFSLPGVSLPQGHDEVRAADGTTCRSAVSGTGAYVDVGFIGAPAQDNTNGNLSAYGRMVIPLARKAPRLDCSKLYNLEVARLEMELKLMQMGLTRGIAPVSESEEPVESSSDDLALNEKGDNASIEVASIKSAKKADEIEDNWAEDGWSTEGLDN